MRAYDTLDSVEAAIARAAEKEFSCVITRDVAIEFLVKHYGAKGEQNIDKLSYALMHPSGDHSDVEFDEEMELDESKSAEENLAEFEKAKAEADEFCLLFTDTQQGDLAEGYSANNEEWRKIAQRKATKKAITEYVNGHELWQIWKR